MSLVFTVKAKGDAVQLSPVLKGIGELQMKLELVKVAAGYLTAPFKAFAAAAVPVLQVTAAFEGLQTRLITTLQSANKASAAFNQLQDFAARTPYGVQELTDSFVKLTNIGLKPTEAALESYGNTASAMGKSLDQWVEAIADATTGEFERLKEFGIKTKSQGDKVSLTFRGVTTTIGKNSREIQKYLEDIGNVHFTGSMERQSRTLAGRWSTLTDISDRMMVAIGSAATQSQGFNVALDGLIKAGTALIPVVTKLVQLIFGMDTSMVKLSGTLGRVDSAARSIVDAFETIGAVIIVVKGILRTVFGVIKTAVLLPLGGMVKTLDALVTGIEYVAEALGVSGDTLKEIAFQMDAINRTYNETMADAFEDVSAIGDIGDELDALSASADAAKTSMLELKPAIAGVFEFSEASDFFTRSLRDAQFEVFGGQRKKKGKARKRKPGLGAGLIETDAAAQQAARTMFSTWEVGLYRTEDALINVSLAANKADDSLLRMNGAFAQLGGATGLAVLTQVNDETQLVNDNFARLAGTTGMAIGHLVDNSHIAQGALDSLNVSFDNLVSAAFEGSAAFGDAILQMVLQWAATFGQFLLTSAGGLQALQSSAFGAAAAAGLALIAISAFLGSAFSSDSGRAVSTGMAPIDSARQSNVGTARAQVVIVVSGMHSQREYNRLAALGRRGARAQGFAA